MKTFKQHINEEKDITKYSSKDLSSSGKHGKLNIVFSKFLYMDDSEQSSDRLYPCLGGGSRSADRRLGKPGRVRVVGQQSASQQHSSHVDAQQRVVHESCGATTLRLRDSGQRTS